MAVQSATRIEIAEGRRSALDYPNIRAVELAPEQLAATPKQTLGLALFRCHGAFAIRLPHAVVLNPVDVAALVDHSHDALLLVVMGFRAHLSPGALSAGEGS